MNAIVQDQLNYHRGNHAKLHHAETGLHRLTNFFFCALGGVALHFVFHGLEWTLILTAGAPAVAAALHGVGIRLGLAHRADLSREMEDELEQIGGHLDALMQPPASTDAEGWQLVRRLAARAAEEMGRENMSWHSLIRRYTDVPV